MTEEDDAHEEIAEPVRAPEPPKRLPRTDDADPDATIQAVVKRINAIRKASGLPELTLNAKLSRAARRHSKDMAEFDFCNHEGSDGSKVWDRVEDAGYKASRVVQNIAAGFASPERAVHAWEQDRNSARNLRDESFREIGVGWYRPPYGGRWCWTVVLAVP
jgi:uncharacterized protein YkwD